MPTPAVGEIQLLDPDGLQEFSVWGGVGNLVCHYIGDWIVHLPAIPSPPGDGLINELDWAVPIPSMPGFYLLLWLGNDSDGDPSRFAADQVIDSTALPAWVTYSAVGAGLTGTPTDIGEPMTISTYDGGWNNLDAGVGSIIVDDPNSDPNWYYSADATITSLTPTSGPAGTSVTITGTGFEVSGASHIHEVTFGGVPATSFTVDSPTQITAIVPSLSAGAHAVSAQVDIFNADLSGGAWTEPSSFTIGASPPSDLTVRSYVMQGCALTIIGRDLDTVTAVRIGTTPVPVWFYHAGGFIDPTLGTITMVVPPLIDPDDAYTIEVEAGGTWYSVTPSNDLTGYTLWFPPFGLRVQRSDKPTYLVPGSSPTFDSTFSSPAYATWLFPGTGAMYLGLTGTTVRMHVSGSFSGDIVTGADVAPVFSCIVNHDIANGDHHVVGWFSSGVLQLTLVYMKQTALIPVNVQVTASTGSDSPGSTDGWRVAPLSMFSFGSPVTARCLLVRDGVEARAFLVNETASTITAQNSAATLSVSGSVTGLWALGGDVFLLHVATEGVGGSLVVMWVDASGAVFFGSPVACGWVATPANPGNFGEPNISSALEFWAIGTDVLQHYTVSGVTVTKDSEVPFVAVDARSDGANLDFDVQWAEVTIAAPTALLCAGQSTQPWARVLDTTTDLLGPSRGLQPNPVAAPAAWGLQPMQGQALIYADIDSDGLTRIGVPATSQTMTCDPYTPPGELKWGWGA